MQQWQKVGYLRKGESFEYEYSLILPEPLASWDVFDYWERARVESMRQHLTHYDVLFDVGAEMGWLSVVYSRICKNVFLIEPEKKFWPNIRQTAERNGFTPIGFYSGLIGEKTDDVITTKESVMNWPKESEGPMIDKNKYQYLHEHERDVPTMSLDDLVAVSGSPTALTIDVEGAELFVLSGATNLLKTKRPKVWVSIHPDLMKSNYGHSEQDVLELMKSFNYDGQFLGADHEQHWLFLPN